MKLSALAASSCLIGLTLAPATHLFAQTAPAQTAIERVKLTDGDLSCRQMHTELGAMDIVIDEAKKQQSSADTTKTAGQVGGVAAEVANRSGLFGQIGGLFGQIAGSVAAKAAASTTEQSGRQDAARAADREKQALARKDHLASLFVARGCKASDPDAAPTNPAATVASLTAATAQAAEAAVPPAELVSRLGSATAPLASSLDLDRNATAITANTRVFVPTFRVAFTVKTQASAYGGGGLANIGNTTGSFRTITQAQNKRVEMALAGADMALLQALTDQIHADFIARLRASGKEVIAPDAISKTQGYEKLKRVAAAPYTTSPSMQGDPRDYIVLAPKGLPLFFMHIDSYIGNTGAFDQDNTKAVAELAARLDAVAYIPTLLIDIAELESSGRSNFRSGAEADVIPKLGVGGRSELRFMNGKDVKIFFTGDMGHLLVKKPLFADGEFGTVATVENFDTANLANALTRATGLQGAQHFVDKRELRVDRRKFASGVLNIGATFSQQVVAAARP